MGELRAMEESKAGQSGSVEEMEYSIYSESNSVGLAIYMGAQAYGNLTTWLWWSATGGFLTLSWQGRRGTRRVIGRLKRSSEGPHGASGFA